LKVAIILTNSLICLHVFF